MDNKTPIDKVSIRGWLVFIAIVLWITAIGGVVAFTESLVSKLFWLEQLLILVNTILSLIVLVFFVQRKRRFVPWFIVLLAWSVLGAGASSMLHYTSTFSVVCTIVGDIILALYVLRSERVKNTFSVKFSDRGMKITWLTVGLLVLVCVGWVIFRTYPRHIALSLKGVEYELGAPKQGVKPVTLQLNGTLHRPLWGKRVFDGTVNIKNATIPNKDNGETLKIVFNPGFGGEILYFNWKTREFYDYGQLYVNEEFNTFTIAVYKNEGKGFGWNGGNGLMITVPANTRAQALQISNTLMKSQLMPGHPLK
ncbi:hypothetical protein [Alicyclobacillus sp. ALC3]|uniref:hypothetical protein n=1 Tax=Alicyclobacillus sp. ALC3 TaxID=2796143 RepID=UPI002377E53C|nr:hypothetical protein [Alicyclobacillus sp. ALC3]WDL96052.1 DUF2569 family protein [Alicyclobacillus sp. ALC3]